MHEQGRRTIVRKLRRCIVMSIRRGCDSYVRAMNAISCSMQYGVPLEAALSYPCFSTTNGLQSFGTARSFSNDNDLRDLIRAASVRRSSSAVPLSKAMRQNQSVAVGRIDEDAPFKFSRQVAVGESLIFPSSRTCASRRKSASVAPS